MIETAKRPLTASLTRGHCPDCDYRGFVLGPHGGASFNVECGNVACRSRFNLTLDATSEVTCAQRIKRLVMWKSEPLDTSSTAC